jgi:Icc-related predicted phosphoesterase
MFTRIFFATDVHGSDVVFRKFLNAGKFYKANVIILGGDVTGKMVIPIVSQPDGTYTTTFLGVQSTLKAEEVQKMETTINDSGFYAYKTDSKEMEDLEKDKENADNIFKRLMIERLERWMTLAEERLKDASIQCYVTGGNDDGAYVKDILSKHEPLVVDPEDKVVKIDDFEMVSCGYSNPTPWHTPREVSEEELAKMIDNMFVQIEDTKNCIFNAHAPPKDLGLDSCPKLDTSVYPPKPITARGGIPVFFGAGSLAVYKAVEKYQPMLALHGHIHESRGALRLGRTLCINPGSEYGEGLLRGVIVNIQKGKGILSYQLTSG